MSSQNLALQQAEFVQTEVVTTLSGAASEHKTRAVKLVEPSDEIVQPSGATRLAEP